MNFVRLKNRNGKCKTEKMVVKIITSVAASGRRQNKRVNTQNVPSALKDEALRDADAHSNSGLLA